MKKLFIPSLVFLALVVVIILTVFLLNKQLPKTQILPFHKQLTFTGNASYPAISPDGKFIAYVVYNTSGEEKVMVQDIVGSQALEIFKGKDCNYLQWLPDGFELAVAAIKDDSHPGIFIVPRLGGTPRYLGARMIFSWSPDGTQLANTYVNLKKIYFMNKSTGESKSIPLKGSFTWIRDIDWSPLGNVLLFETKDEKQRSAIWTIAVDGSQQNKVVEESIPLFSPRWSPKGDAIYYLLGQGRLKELWKIPVSKNTGKPSGPATLVLGGLQAGIYFSIADNGKRMLYTRQFSYNNISLARVEGSGKDRTVKTKQLTTGTLWHGDPSISPDGKLIAFSRGDGEKGNIFIMPIEGGNPKQITFLNSFTIRPVWSPDGEEIAFGSKEGGVPRVWKVSVHGGEPRQFSETTLSETFSIVWYPGAKIIYQRPGNRNFHVLDPKTGKEVPLVEDDSVGWIFSPYYSPDGKRVAVFWNRPPSRALWVISLEDYSQTLIKEGEFMPAGWADDGKWVHAFDEKAEKYVKIGIESGKVEALPAMPFEHKGETMRILLDGKPMVFLDFESHSDVWVVENFDPDVK